MHEHAHFRDFPGHVFYQPKNKKVLRMCFLLPYSASIDEKNKMQARALV
jgi:hypothetical protein